MNEEFKSSGLEEIHEESIYGNHEVAEEQIIYCGDEYSAHGSIYEVEVEADGSHIEDVFSPESMNAANQDHSICYYCKENLSNKRFYVHLFDHHGFTKQQCEIMKQQKRLETSKRNTRKSLHSCLECGLEFITKSGLNSHLTKKDIPCGQALSDEQNGDDSAVCNIVCPTYGCNSHFSTYLDLAVHVDTNHRDLVNPNNSFMIRRKHFPDKNSFMKWKKQMEDETNSEFFLRTSQKVSFAIRTTLYKCLCSNSRGQKKRKCEQCPAFIKACQRNHGQFEVVACFGHLGHEHSTETPKAINYRLSASRDLNSYQNRGKIPNNRRQRQQNQMIVDEYGNPTHHSNGMMILMPGTVEEDDEFSQVIVDDEEIDVQSVEPEQEVYIQSSHHYSSQQNY
uniref:C2H2-type domain-containing protein n=1 Tax=Caenorhabditis tropicalis TaxID=1561998 RepID=A0A1I7U614_9PELO